MAGRWTLLLRSTHDGKVREANLGVTVAPTPSASSGEAPSPDEADGLAAEPPEEDPGQALVPKPSEDRSRFDAIAALLAAASLCLIGVFFWLVRRRQQAAPVAEIQGVQLARGPVRVHSTGATLRSLRVSLVMDRGPTRVSLHPESAQETP